MQYLLIFGIVLQMIVYVYKNQEDYEPFYLFKCILYLFISTIHSVIICVKLPLGACLMGVIYLVDKKNGSVKLRLIASGVIIVILSALSYKDINIPFQNLYLYTLKSDASKIEVFTNNGTTNKYLFSITNKNDIMKWSSSLKSSTPYSAWNYKIIPKNTGYLLKFYTPTKTLSLIVVSVTPNLPNLFIGKTFIPYTNSLLPDLISSYDTAKPLSLKIVSDNIAITDINIINTLWKEILWDNQVNLSHININTFKIQSKLVLSQNKEISLSFSTNFNYLKLNNTEVIELSEHLKNKLKEQYILSQLDSVNTFTEYAPVHIHTLPRNLNNYSIELDRNGKSYGLYSKSGIGNTKLFLHNVSSSTSQYYVLKSPYLLLLDEKAPSQYYLMLVNQNIPDKHRYVEKSKNIMPSSIALCPNNTKFAYTINTPASSTLYLVNNYYEPPIVLAHGNILDSLFLSDQYIIFTLALAENNALCIYDTILSKTVKYIAVPGNIHLIRVQNNSIVFSVQKEENNRFSEGIFTLDSILNIKRIE